MMPVLRKAPFAQRISLGIGLIVALQLIIVVSAYQIFFSLLHTNQLVAHTQEVRTGLLDLLSAVEDVETGQRGYLLTGDSLYLQPYYRAQQSVEPGLARLQRLTQDNPEQQYRIQQLRLAVRNKLDEVEQTLQLYNQRRYAESQLTILSNRGQKDMETIRQTIATMRDSESHLLKQRTQSVSTAARRILQALTGLFGLILALTGTTLHLTRRYVQERRQIEGVLRAGEARYRRLLETSYEGIWTLNTNGETDFINARGARLLGCRPEEMVGKSSRMHIFGEDVALWLSLLKAGQEGSGSETELRMARKNNSVIFVQVSRSPIYSPDGTHLGTLCMFSEITDRKRAEAERTELLRRLVSVQEEERRRISRELHDETGQYLTALMLGLDAVVTAVPHESPIREQIQHLQRFSRHMGRDMHRIAWELRPTALDDMGLEVALQNYLEEWSERVEIQSDFHSDMHKCGRMPPEIETTLYRAVQEALTNIAKHARAERVSLILERQAGHVSLIVEDDGVGIDPELLNGPNPSRQTMGLIGIKERVALVGGTFTLESTPGQGTTLFLRIPISTSPVSTPPVSIMDGSSHSLQEIAG